MKKRVFSFIGLSTIMVVVVFNVSLTLGNNALSDLASSNVEALAQN